MKLIIDIPEILFEKIQNRKADKRTLETVIMRGIPQEPILDKIRAEIEELPCYVAKFNGGDFAIHIDKEKVFDIIDKYRGEA